MWVTDLWGKHKGEIIYVVGTGPSMRLFDCSFFEDKITIGLNQSWKYFMSTYSLTIHSELIQEFEKNNPNVTKHWITKAWKKPVRPQPRDSRYYVFMFREPSEELGSDLNLLRRQTHMVYHGRGIHCTAMNVALHMGASAIILVGCDMCALGGDHHGHKQHVKWNGLDPDDVYYEYRTFSRDVRDFIQEQKKVPVFTLSPFVGLDASEDYEYLVKRKGLCGIPMPKDTSSRERLSIDSPEKCRK